MKKYILTIGTTYHYKTLNDDIWRIATCRRTCVYTDHDRVLLDANNGNITFRLPENDRKIIMIDVRDNLLEIIDE